MIAVSSQNYAGQLSVDIVLATFNGEKYLEELIDSIVEQTYACWRIVACDDGSTDGTMRILQRYSELHPGKVIVPKLAPSGSACKNFLRGVSLCDSDLIMFADQDDVWLPDKIQMFVDEYVRAGCPSAPCLIFSDLRVVDYGLATANPSFMRYSKLNPQRTKLNQALPLNCVAGCASMINRSLANLVIASHDLEGIIMHDAWILLLASAFGMVVYIDKATVLYRQHDGNQVGAKGHVGAVANGVLRQNRKQMLHKTTNQATVFLGKFEDDLSDSSREIVEAYCSLSNSSKFRTIAICTKYGFWKYGLSRKIDQLMHL